MINYIFEYIVEDNPSYLHKYGTEILIFVLAISFEIKENESNEDKKQEIKYYSFDEYPSMASFISNREEGKKLFSEEFTKKYYLDLGKYVFTSSAIYNYITKGFFNVTEFINELEKKEEVAEDYRPIKNYKIIYIILGNVRY